MYINYNYHFQGICIQGGNVGYIRIKIETYMLGVSVYKAV